MPFPVTTVLDNCTRANEGPPPSANWSTDQFGFGLPGWKIASNLLVPNGSNAAAYWSAATFGPICGAFVQVQDLVVTGNELDLGIRLQGGVGTSAVDGYAIKIVYDSAGADTIRILRYDNGAGTALGADISFALTPGDFVGITADGSTISAWHGASLDAATLLGSRTEGTYSAGGNLGIYAGNPDTKLSSFGGGSYAPGARMLASTGVGT